MAPECGKPIHHLPLVPADVLKKHRVHESLDTRFRSAARLLQALWREDRALPIGNYVGEDGKRRKLGSRISRAAGKAGGNFLTPEIAHTARREAAYREIGALIDAERLATNLLSSMPLTFNLLAPWGHSLEPASSYLIELLPAFTGPAHQILFEHSPGRGNPKYTGDFTAFDALIRYSDGQGRNGFVAFEIKYSESMREPMPELKPRHAELSDANSLFIDPAAAALRTSPLQQFWRETLLAQSMIANGLYDEGSLVVIAPALNYHVQDAAEAYHAHLREPEDGKVRFANLILEDVIETIRLSDPAHAEALHHRYCDFWLVDGELERNAPRFGLPAKRRARKPAPAPEYAANPIDIRRPVPSHSNKSLESSVMSSTPTPTQTVSAQENHRHLRGWVVENEPGHRDRGPDAQRGHERVPVEVAADAAARKLLDELARSAGRTVERASSGIFLTPGVEQRAAPAAPAVSAGPKPRRTRGNCAQVPHLVYDIPPRVPHWSNQVSLPNPRG